MTNIIGIDFSGARGDRNTWVASGHLTARGALQLDGAQMTPRQVVTELLSSVPSPVVAGIDFPFSLPRPFAEFLTTDTLTTMPDVWRALSELTLSDFIAARDAFVHRFGEPKRAGDEAHFRESFSPLHKVNPNMLPMTYYGIRMLHELHQNHRDRWQVPPIPSDDVNPGESVTLLETMPGAFLRSIGTIYKGYKKPGSPQLRDERRNTILDALECRAGLEVLNLSAVRDECLANDDCLDSVVAAVTAACWAQDQLRFVHPDESELVDATLEGWIYVPRSAE